MSDRQCGRCVACCVYPRIPELSKAGLEACPHLDVGDGVVGLPVYTGPGAKNCGVYSAGRPGCCKRYRCAWRAGHGDDSDRPDRALMLFDRSKQIDNCLEAKPLADGQESTPEGQAVIARMSRSVGMPVVVLDYCERRVVRIAGRPVS